MEFEPGRTGNCHRMRCRKFKFNASSAVYFDAVCTLEAVRKRSVESSPFPISSFFVVNSSANPRGGRRIEMAEQEEMKGGEVTPEKAAGEAEAVAIELTAPAGWTKKVFFPLSEEPLISSRRCSSYLQFCSIRFLVPLICSACCF